VLNLQTFIPPYPFPYAYSPLMFMMNLMFLKWIRVNFANTMWYPVWNALSKLFNPNWKKKLVLQLADSNRQNQPESPAIWNPRPFRATIFPSIFYFRRTKGNGTCQMQAQASEQV
jgi:hypothetical protein